MTKTYPCSFAEVATQSLEEMLPYLPKGSLRKVRMLGTGTLTDVKVTVMKLCLANREQSCVVKQIPRSTMDSATGIECPRNEFHAALALKNLNLPNVAKILFLAQDEKYFYLGSEYCPNRDLFSTLDIAGRLKEPVLREVLSQILLGVRGLHEAGIAHRDLSLENIVVDANGDCRIIDFAQAVMVRDQNYGSVEARLHVSEEQGPPGKQQYRGPELSTGASYLATKVDSFAIGIMFYALVVGQYPKHEELFPAAEAASGRCTRLHLLLQKANKKLAEQISPGCLDMMEQLLAPNPELRLSVEEALMHPWLIGTISGQWPADDEQDEIEEVSTHRASDTDSTIDYPYSDNGSFGDYTD